MEPLPLALYGAQQLAEIDRRATQEGLPGETLMQRAGEAAFRSISARWPVSRHWLVYAGAGNNGGDGYVVAREALQAGCEVTVAALGEPREDSTAGRMARAFTEAGGRVVPWDEAAPQEADLVVDALFGIGLNRALEGDAAAAVDAINAAGRPVAAIDIPSGLVADTGAAAGSVVQAALTITFIGLKLGLFTGIGPRVRGRLVYSRIGVPEQIDREMQPLALRITGAFVRQVLRPRLRDAHKGHFGHVLVAGGDSGTGGAVSLAAQAALRTGAGLVSAMTRPEHVPALIAARPEIMAHGLDENADFPEAAARATVAALGPGLGQSAWSRRVWETGLALDRPLVVDADGLNLLARHPQRRDDWILTPHPGEAARLLDTDVPSVEKDRLQAVHALTERYGGVVVLKGVGTLVAAAGSGEAWLCDRGNPGMASGGMGDALTGVIASLLAQGLDPLTAARTGVWLHASAADRASLDGERGLLASDLIAELRHGANP